MRGISASDRVARATGRAKLALLAISLLVPLLAAACSSGPSAGFTKSTDGGYVPLEVRLTPDEDGSDAAFHWEFGDGETSDEREPTHSYQDAGDFTVRLTVTSGGSTKTSEQLIHTLPGEAGWVIIEPAQIDVESGERVSLTATAFDTLGNPVPNADITFSVNPDAGSLEESGAFVAGPNVGQFPQAVTASFERQGATGTGTSAATISYGALDVALIDPAEINVRVNERVSLGVIARDRQGHVLPGAQVEWFPLRQGDTVAAGGEFIAGQTPTAGPEDLLRVIVTVGEETQVHTVHGTISPGILDRLEVSVMPETASIGAPVTLSAVGFDRFGNQLELDAVEWELLSPEYGEITDDGVFTPSGAAVSAGGPLVSITGSVGSVSRVVEVPMNVLPGPAVAVSIIPEFDSVAVGAGNPFYAVAVDEWGNEIDSIAVEWAAGAGGEITPDGVFIAGFETGEFTEAVTATLPAGAAGNEEDLTATADVRVRDRSSDMLAVEVSSQFDAGIILIDLINGDIRPLAEKLETDSGIEVAPAWWPDGSKLAYASDVSGTVQIFDIDIETEEVRQLTDVPDGATMPAISPDGTKLAFVLMAAERDWQVYVADIPEPGEDGSIEPVMLEDATKISADDTIQSLLPWWSPDGTQIAFTTSRSLNDVDIRLAPADGSAEPQIVGRAGLSAFGWSEDGEHILAVDVQAQTANTLLVVEVATGEAAGYIPVPFNAFMASWAPGGSEAAVVDRFSGALWLVDADGTSLRQAVNSSFVPRRTSWRPVPIDAEAVLAGQEAADDESPDESDGGASPLST